MRAMILAAGYGTRLWPLTLDRTKPAIPFLGRPLVGYVAQYLAGYDCREIIVNLHHQPLSVRRALGDGSRFGVHLNYVEELEILGTSGALDNARDFLERDTFVVINGKIITDIDLAAAIETHRRTKAIATLVLRRNAQRERFSVVETERGFVTGFGSMPGPILNASDNANERDSSRINGSGEANDLVPLMFTGIQILEPRIFDYIPRRRFSHSTTDVYPQAIKHGERIAAHVADGMWYELSTLERYLDISLVLLAKEGRDVYSGANSVISSQAAVRDSILWECVTIEAGAQVRRVVLGDGVTIRSGRKIENAAVVRADLIVNAQPPAKALKGEICGDNFVVPLTQ
jgi:NDP-sugar pyrophosphorylase family protein